MPASHSLPPRLLYISSRSTKVGKKDNNEQKFEYWSIKKLCNRGAISQTFPYIIDTAAIKSLRKNLPIAINPRTRSRMLFFMFVTKLEILVRF